MRSRVEALLCDADGCEAQVIGPAVRLERLGAAAGWQVGAIVSASADEDGPDIERTDRCPDHHALGIQEESAVEELFGVRPGTLRRRIG